MNTFREAVRQKDFVITAELPLHSLRSKQEIHDCLTTLQAAVDAVQLGCDESAEGQVSPLAAASIALQCGVDPIVHLSSRDRNRLALQSDILGAMALGVSNLVLRRGEKLPSSLRGRVKGVFDTKTTQLLTLARRIADGSEIGDDVFLGCLVSAVQAREDWKAKLVVEKLGVGAKFLQTRPSAELDKIRTYAARLVSLKITHRASVIVAVPQLMSVVSARRISDRYPGTEIPEALIERLGKANDTRAESISMLREFLAELTEIPGVSGAAIVNVEDADAVAAAVEGT